MRIIKNGKQEDQKREIEITCNYCKSIFAATKKEFGTLKRDRDGAYYNIKCPVCHKQQFVAASVVDK